MKKSFLPLNKKEMKDRGWDEVDIVLVSGDAYVDHPAFGTAVIGRQLEAAGYRVGIIAMPDFKSPDCMKVFGRPRLFLGSPQAMSIPWFPAIRLSRKSGMTIPTLPEGNRVISRTGLSSSMQTW